MITCCATSACCATRRGWPICGEKPPLRRDGRDDARLAYATLRCAGLGQAIKDYLLKSNAFLAHARGRDDGTTSLRRSSSNAFDTNS
jgi:hypothetical protein